MASVQRMGYQLNLHEERAHKDGKLHCQVYGKIICEHLKSTRNNRRKHTCITEDRKHVFYPMKKFDESFKQLMCHAIPVNQFALN